MDTRLQDNAAPQDAQASGAAAGNSTGASAGASIEEILEQVKELSGILEQGDLPLEEALDCYEQGIRLIRECTSMIDKAEKRIQVLEEEGEE